MTLAENLHSIIGSLPRHVKLIAISKTHSIETIMIAYDAGQRVFGENKVQEMVAKYNLMPKDIEWHLVGHLQTNKVKYITPFVSLIHSVDSLKLLILINKEAEKLNRTIDCLLQVYIATEETKYGLTYDEIETILESPEYKQMRFARIIGVMGMASFTSNPDQVRREFKNLKELFDRLKSIYFRDKYYFKEISMGMSSDYKIAVEEGSTMVRIGSNIFGTRNYNT